MTSLPPRTELRCAAASSAAEESLAGTAAPIRSWLLLERPGAWSQAAVAETLAAVLPLSQRRVVQSLTREAGLRTLLIRRPGRGSESADSTVLVGSAVPGVERLERLRLPSLEALAELDLSRIPEGGLGEPVAGPVFLVCTHGAKDMCCALDGRPLARTLWAEYGDRVWECSHVGGDRFAGNLVVAPYAEYYGRLDAHAALAAAATALRGDVAVPGFRGRAAYDSWAQVAESCVRERLGLTRRDDVRVVASTAEGTTARVRVWTTAGTWSLTLERRMGGVVAGSRCRGGFRSVDYAVGAFDVVPPEGL